MLSNIPVYIYIYTIYYTYNYWYIQSIIICKASKLDNDMYSLYKLLFL